MTALMVLALAFTHRARRKQRVEGFCSLALGLWLGMIGLDMVTGSAALHLRLDGLCSTV